MIWRSDGADAQRVAVVGATGTGKTTLVRSLAARARRVVWWDTKGLGEHGLPVVAAVGDGGDRVAIAPAPGDPPELQLDEVAREVYLAGNALLVIDDAMVAVPGATPPPWVQSIVTMGRARGIGVISIIQRPVAVPRLLLTEAEHLVAFRVRHPDDAELLARLAHPGLRRAAELPRWEYLWADTEAQALHWERLAKPRRGH